jgi:hypothetical protein
MPFASRHGAQRLSRLSVPIRVAHRMQYRPAEIMPPLTSPFGPSVSGIRTECDHVLAPASMRGRMVAAGHRTYERFA